MPLYELLHELLDNNWKYFYKSSVVKTFGAVSPSEPLSHQAEFTSILGVSERLQHNVRSCGLFCVGTVCRWCS